MARSYVDPATFNTAATCVGLLTPSIARMARAAMLSWLETYSEFFVSGLKREPNARFGVPWSKRMSTESARR
jgi:hypothetical protein